MLVILCLGAMEGLWKHRATRSVCTSLNVCRRFVRMTQVKLPAAYFIRQILLGMSIIINEKYCQCISTHFGIRMWCSTWSRFLHSPRAILPPGQDYINANKSLYRQRFINFAFINWVSLELIHLDKLSRIIYQTTGTMASSMLAICDYYLAQVLDKPLTNISMDSPLTHSIHGNWVFIKHGWKALHQNWFAANTSIMLWIHICCISMNKTVFSFRMFTATRLKFIDLKLNLLTSQKLTISS